MNPIIVLDFWFEEHTPEYWYKKDPEFDGKIIREFSDIHKKAAENGLLEWRKSSEGRLAEIILLDQFSRNMFRDTPKAFAYDDLALKLAKEAVDNGADNDFGPQKVAFLYMPYMHSEDLDDHEEAVKLFSREGLEGNLKYEYKHKEIIEKFGRYPHRNEILGRESTPEEIEFLKQDGSSF